jgi:hypothetical protein
MKISLMFVPLQGIKCKRCTMIVIKYFIIFLVKVSYGKVLQMWIDLFISLLCHLFMSMGHKLILSMLYL